MSVTYYVSSGTLNSTNSTQLIESTGVTWRKPVLTNVDDTDGFGEFGEFNGRSFAVAFYLAPIITAAM